MLSLDFLALPLMAASALIFVAVFTGIISSRVGFPFLLVFLIVGGLSGVDGIGGIEFNDFELSFWVGNIALAVILADGGLRTDFSTFRTGLKPSLILATFGVVLSAALTGLAAMWLLELSWPMAMLLGAIVGSTDAAAVFSLLKSCGVRLNERVAATLEIESGMNDPMAVYLTLLFIGVAAAATSDAMDQQGAAAIAISFVQQFSVGALVGIGGGYAIASVMNRMRGLLDGGAGILALLLMSAGIGVFALTTWLGGSGFLAIYIFGVLVGNRARKTVRQSLSAMDGFAWLAQALMFLLLGLLVNPSEVTGSLWPALGIALFLMLVARPAAVGICLAPFHFTAKETLFIAWVGLRGAVPVVLAIFPMMAGIEGADTLFHVAFVVVVTSLLLQGGSLAWVARWWGLVLPETGDSKNFRRVFGDFVLDASITVGQVCGFYDLPEPPDADKTLSAWITDHLRRPPIVGDRITIGHAEFVVRQLKGTDIAIVGMKLPQETD